MKKHLGSLLYLFGFVTFVLGNLGEVRAYEQVLINDPGGATNSQKVYVLDHTITKGYFEAKMNGDLNCSNVDKSHPLSGWEFVGNYSHHQQNGSFAMWRIGANYSPFKLLATPQGLPEREEARHDATLTGIHTYRLEFIDGTVSFILDGITIREWQFSRFAMKVFVIGKDDLYGICNPALAITNVKVVEYIGQPPTPTLTPTPAPTPTPDPNIETKVKLYDLFEIRIPSGMQWEHPFTDTNVYGHFRKVGAGWRQWKGFYDGEGTWVVRFRPDSSGVYEWKTFSVPAHAVFDQTGFFDCIAPREGNHGPLQRSGQFIFHADGSDPYWIGATAFGLPFKDTWQEYLQQYLAEGITYYRVGSWFFIECEQETDCFLGLWPFEVWPYPCEQPVNYTEMNISQFQRLDGILQYLHEHNAYAEICIYSGRSSEQLCSEDDIYQVDDPRQIPYLDYLVARFRAYPNLVWEIGNEIRNWDGGYQWLEAREWVHWVGNYMKFLDPEHLISYDAQWAEDPWWYWDPVIYPEWLHPDISHKECWEASWCDIVCAHTDRTTGHWWYRGPEQIRQLSELFGKPVFNDEPHRKGYTGVVTDDEIRRSAYLTVMIGNAWHTIHGVSGKGTPEDPLCAACVQGMDLANGFVLHLNKFFAEVGQYNFYSDNSLIEGPGQYLRAMYRDNIYVYSAFAAAGQFVLKTNQLDTYQIKVMDSVSGIWLYQEVMAGQNFSVDIPPNVDFIAYVKKIEDNPTPTLSHWSMLICILFFCLLLLWFSKGGRVSRRPAY
ncbi:DUF5060 domain-containing protein [candidate division CSSED10-310 bacterium]|uniref:DUF5060 domain-containing protein n=1 Tax=candidate division CSSED10-310 bacterium TaxID=2855610 RepID=A0ABV6Z535_UNCC1